MTISEAEIPSSVTLVWAAAGRCANTSAIAAKAIDDLNMLRLLSLARVERRGPIDPSTSSSSELSRNRALGVHHFDLGGVALVHETPLELHCRRQLLVLRC